MASLRSGASKCILDVFLWHEKIVEGGSLVLYSKWRFYFWVCINIEYYEHIHDCCQGQGGRRIGYLLASKSGTCNCKCLRRSLCQIRVQGVAMFVFGMSD